jgi:hypothetical protein
MFLFICLLLVFICLSCSDVPAYKLVNGMLFTLSYNTFEDDPIPTIFVVVAMLNVHPMQVM